jgi:hypothetical protein
MGKLLVEIDLNEGLPTEMDIVWRGIVYQQRLDYIGVPFRCVQFVRIRGTCDINVWEFERKRHQIGLKWQCDVEVEIQPTVPTTELKTQRP